MTCILAAQAEVLLKIEHLHIFIFLQKTVTQMRVRTSKANFAKFVTAVHLPLTIADNHLTVSFSLCRNRRFPHK